MYVLSMSVSVPVHDAADINPLRNWDVMKIDTLHNIKK